MKQRELIKQFFKREVKWAKASSLRVEDTKLIYYETTLAEYFNGEWIINDTKYSPMTSKLQTYIRVDADKSDFSKHFIIGIPRGVKDLAYRLKEVV